MAAWVAAPSGAECKCACGSSWRVSARLLELRFMMQTGTQSEKASAASLAQSAVSRTVTTYSVTE